MVRTKVASFVAIREKSTPTTSSPPKAVPSMSQSPMSMRPRMKPPTKLPFDIICTTETSAVDLFGAMVFEFRHSISTKPAIRHGNRLLMRRTVRRPHLPTPSTTPTRQVSLPPSPYRRLEEPLLRLGYRQNRPCWTDCRVARFSC